MATERSYISLPEAIGSSIRAYRTKEGLAQEELARLTSSAGMPWTRATVASIETGRRKLSLDELFGLSIVCGVPLSEWLVDDGSEIDLFGGSISSTELAAIVAGAVPTQSASSRMMRRLDPTLGDPESTDRLIVRELWKKAKRPDLENCYRSCENETEQRLSRKFGIDVMSVVLLSISLWGVTFTDERERRVEKATSRRSLQAARGHISRAMIKDLEALAASYKERGIEL